MIIANNITKDFSGSPILENIKVKIGNGKKIGVVGKNGCGKTTLFNLLTGDLTPDGGTIHLQSENIGYLPQELHSPIRLLAGIYWGIWKMIGKPTR